MPAPRPPKVEQEDDDDDDDDDDDGSAENAIDSKVATPAVVPTVANVAVSPAAGIDHMEITLSAEDGDRLSAWAHARNSSLAAAFLASWVIILRRYQGLGMQYKMNHPHCTHTVYFHFQIRVVFLR